MTYVMKKEDNLHALRNCELKVLILILETDMELILLKRSQYRWKTIQTGWVPSACLVKITVLKGKNFGTLTFDRLIQVRL